MRGVMVDPADPLADQLLQLADVVERLPFAVLAARPHVWALVAGQLLQQRLPQGAEEPFQRGLVGRLVRDRRLDRDPEPFTYRPGVLGQVDLAVVDHDGVRQHPTRVGEHDPFGQAAVRAFR